jgi:hypothetical protein
MSYSKNACGAAIRESADGRNKPTDEIAKDSAKGKILPGNLISENYIRTYSAFRASFRNAKGRLNRRGKLK